MQFNIDELPADILALLASCGQAVRKTDLPKVLEVMAKVHFRRAHRHARVHAERLDVGSAVSCC